MQQADPSLCIPCDACFENVLAYCQLTDTVSKDQGPYLKDQNPNLTKPFKFVAKPLPSLMVLHDKVEIITG